MKCYGTDHPYDKRNEKDDEEFTVIVVNKVAPAIIWCHKIKLLV